MKHEITSMNTKKTLAASLKKFMEKKAFSKITVSEIVTDCKINRKTFYYHFEDTRALLKWMLEQEAFEVVKHYDFATDYEKAILFVIDYVEENKHILSCAYDSLGRGALKNFFSADLIGVAQTVICDLEKSLGIHVDEEFKTFLCQFYTEAVSGMIINYFTGGSARNREILLKYVSSILTSSIPNILMANVK